MDRLKNLDGHLQDYDGSTYNIKDLVIASEGLKVIRLTVEYISLEYLNPAYDTMSSFIEHSRRVRDADLKYPIILAPSNFILDGKHRLIKAILNNMKYIKAVKFKEMPDCGTLIKDD